MLPGVRGAMPLTTAMFIGPPLFYSTLTRHPPAILGAGTRKTTTSTTPRLRGFSFLFPANGR
jgi:hypothetical protein